MAQQASFNPPLRVEQRWPGAEVRCVLIYAIDGGAAFCVEEASQEFPRWMSVTEIDFAGVNEARRVRESAGA